MSSKLIVISILLGLIVFQAFRISTDAGAFVEIKPVDYGRCEKLYGPPGSEDINVDRINRVAFISSSNGREAFESYRSGKPGQVADGDIWVLDLSVADSLPRPLKVDAGSKFHPHGIDLLTLPSGARELYVVNHPARDQHEILIFTVGANHGLTLKRRIHYPELISPNDIKAIDTDRFFVTNDHGSPQSSFMARVEEYLGLSWSSVSYFDGNKGSFLLQGLKSANGITMSDDRQTLYVAEALGRSVKRYRRGKSNRQWKFADKISVDTAVDNLEWSDDGRLLSGTHPKIFPLLEHFDDPAAISPSQVIAINVQKPEMTVETLYMNNGSELSGSSVATLLDGELLIGAVAETHFLRCRNE